MTPRRQRRQPLTIMFCDMVGSTGLAQRQDVEAQAGVVGRFHALCRDAITARGGTVAQYLGDGVMAYFGHPVLREQEVGNAVHAALAIRAALAGPAGGASAMPQVRIGLATGLVLVGDLGEAGVTQELAAIGPATNLAARLQAAAPPQGVVICPETRRLLRGRARLAALGPQRLKGIEAPVEAFAVLGIDDEGRARLEGRELVGRQVELAWLDQLAVEAGEGRGCLAVVESDAGVGKSRLMRGFLDRRAAPGTRLRRIAGSDCFSDRPYWPLLQALRPELAAAEGTARPLAALHEGAVRTLTAMVRALEGDATASLTDRAAIQSSFLDWFIGPADAEPLIALCEDVHWYDPSTLAWLDLLGRAVTDRKVLVLCTTRPRDAAGARPLADAPSIRLAPLRPAEAERLIDACDREGRIGREARRRILDEAAGVPLFIEELAEAALDRPQAPAPAPAPAGPTQPATLSHGLLARIAAIDGAEPVCAALSAVGADAGAGLVAAACGLGPAEASAVLDRLVRAGIVAERGSPPAFGLRHVLLRDAVYETVLVDARAPLHGRIAAALAASGDADPALLARHHALAGDHAAAATAWHEAGLRAVRGAAHGEASRNFRSALAAIARLPLGEARDRLELAAQSSLGLSLLGGEGYAGDTTIAALERARALMQTLGEVGKMPTVLTSLTAAYFNRAEYQRSLDIREELLVLAEIEGDPASLCVAHRGVATVYNVFGRFEDARRHAATAWSFYDLRRDGPRAAAYPTDIGTAAAAQLALALWHRGEPDEARRMIRASLAIASQLDHKNSLGYALTYGVIFEGYLTQDHARARDYARRLQALGETFGMPQWTIWGRCSGAASDAHLGDPQAALAMLKAGLGQRAGLTGNRALGALFHIGVADTLRLAGQDEAARAELGRAAAVAAQTGETWMDGQRLMIEARLHAGAGRQDEAARALAGVRDVAKAQGSAGLAGRIAGLAAALGLPPGPAA